MVMENDQYAITLCGHDSFAFTLTWALGGHSFSQSYSSTTIQVSYYYFYSNRGTFHRISAIILGFSMQSG